MASQTQLAPFRNNTRQRWQRISPAVPISFGGTGTVLMPQVGLYSRIFLFVNAVVTDTAATPSTPTSSFGAYNLLKRITLQLNLGTANVVDVSGYGAYMVNKVTDTCIEMRSNNYDVTGDVLYQYPTTLTQNVGKAVTFGLLIPVAANDGENFSVGLINGQSPELRANINVQFGLPSDLYPGSTTSATQTVTGTVQAYYQYYEVPDPDTVALPARVMHRLVEDRTPIAATGDVTYLTPRQGVLLQMMHNVILNGTIDKSPPVGGNVTGRRLIFNKTDLPYAIDPIVDRIENRLRFGFSGVQGDLPGGMYIWDLFNSSQAPTRGDLRDAVDTEALSTLESVITISPSATLGVGNNYLDTVRRIMQQYAVVGVASAGALLHLAKVFGHG